MKLIVLFTVIVALRTIVGVDAFSDVEQQLPEGHAYACDDKITHVHECTHGINSRLRKIYKKPSFYVLHGRAVILEEPEGTLKQVADAVPQDLRAPQYQLYLVTQQRDWNEQPTYVFDELSAYINGAQQRQDQGRSDREGAIERMAEFIPYSLCVPMALKVDDPKMRAFLRYQFERAIVLGADRYLELGELKGFARSYFGTLWCHVWFGI